MADTRVEMVEMTVTGDDDSDYDDAVSAKPAGSEREDSEYGGKQLYCNVATQRRAKKKRSNDKSLELPTARPRKTRVPTTRMARRFKDLDPDELQYNVEDVPPWYLCIALGFQHCLIMFGGTAANVLVLAPAMCIADDDNIAKSELIGTIFVCSGIATLLQNILGVRLPLVQGGTFTFVTPSFAILSLDRWACSAAVNQTVVDSFRALPMSTNAFISPGNITDVNETPLWKPRIREIQGAIMVASLFQVVIGFSGLIGIMLRWIGPLAIAPTIALAGLTLFDIASEYAAKQWWIALVTVVLIIAFSQYSKNIQVPCFTFRRGEGCNRMGFPVFRLFPVILSMSVVWLLCVILTECGIFPDGAQSWAGANTHNRLQLLQDAPWIRFPYPGQWGLPTVSIASVFGMLAGVLASMVESVGDYYACARMAGVPPPPMHAVNRGIGMEGIACILCGAFGSSSGTTAYSENIGAIGITKVASRRVIEVSAIIMLLFGICNKFGILFVTIPDPIIGGIFIVMFGMVTAIGISNLQFADLNSSRNLFIIGFSFFFGLSLPKYLSENKNVIATGNDSVDQIITVLLSTSMFVGGFSGFLLDNTIPGTDKERGLLSWRNHLSKPVRMLRSGKKGTRDYHVPERSTKDPEMINQVPERSAEDPKMIYQIPLTSWMNKHKWAEFIPFLHTFDEDLFSIRKKVAKRISRKERNKREEEKKEENNGATTDV